MDADQLAEAAETPFATHPDAEVLTSFPGLGVLTGARILAELGDDRGAGATALLPDAPSGAG